MNIKNDICKKTKSDLDVGELFSAIAHAEKYQSRNFISRFLVNNFLKSILQTVHEAGSIEVHEIGCGEGHIMGMLAQNNYQVRGCDISESSLAVAKAEIAARGLDISLHNKSIYELEQMQDSSDTVLCCEVLEHLDDPELALKKLLSVTKKNLILSVPREPIWHLLNMARGKYWYALGNTPGHYQHWTRKMFVDFVSLYADVIKVKTPLPWILIHCRPKL